MSSGRGHICAMTIIFALLFGCLALPVTGRSVSKLLGAKDTVGPATNTISGNINDSTVNSTTTSGDGGRKIHLIFCVYKSYFCVHDHCFCCQKQKSEAASCFKTQKECRLQPYLLEQHGAGNS
ncbi:hypothetical protein SORBI_3004G029601 [Sorghum bicolor]|uniref:Uncharacterized protein n=1 Tax=Sorghum bicolor TaxID=4558 RepID=A0A1Z5RKM2_SORBI|nr:hypothetical protein SORBI_3004G029601 [Sorghum bicolor]